MRVLVMALAALSVSACNVVMSERPLFSEADARRAPPFRDGPWVSLTAECLDEWTKPEPPPCAEHGDVRGGRLVAPDDPGQSVIVAGGGEPLIVQIRFTEKEAATGKPFTIHIFGALKPTRFDAEGRVLEVRRWLVLCGPPPPSPPGSSLRREEALTLSPLPGMRVDKKLGVCFARDAAAVRRAAAASEAWDEERGIVRWAGEPPAGGGP